MAAGDGKAATWNRRLIAALADHAEGRAALVAVCDAIREMLPCDRVQIWRGDVRQMTMSTVVASGYPEADARRLADLLAPMPTIGLGHDFLVSKAAFVPDTRSEPDAIAGAAFTPFGLEAVGLLLLERGERPIGALQLAWCRGAEARMPDADAAEAIRRHAGLGLDFLARTEDAVRLSETLSATAIALGTIHDPNELLHTTAAAIAEAAGCEFATVHLLEEDGTTLRRVAHHGLPQSAHGEERVRVNLKLLGQVATTEEGVFEVPDVTLVEGATAHFPPVVSSYFGIPLLQGGRLVCVLTIGYRERKGRFSRRQISLAKGLAHHALAALRNARVMQSLREVSQAKTDFIAAVSHDLRTPLHILVGYSDMLLEGATGELNSEQAELIRRMRDGAFRFRDLIDDVIDVARLDAGQGVLALSPVSLPAICEDLRQELEVLRQPGVELRFALGGLTVLGDAAKIKMLLRNLLTNALKFTQVGEVGVTAEPNGDDGLVLRVRDTGPGIGSEDRPRIFEMFQQGEAGRRAGGSGLGLGLYLVKRVATILGGDVRLESGEPGNTVFEVRLPLRSPSE